MPVTFYGSPAGQRSLLWPRRARPQAEGAMLNNRVGRALFASHEHCTVGLEEHLALTRDEGRGGRGGVRARCCPRTCRQPDAIPELCDLHSALAQSSLPSSQTCLTSLNHAMEHGMGHWISISNALVRVLCQVHGHRRCNVSRSSVPVQVLCAWQLVHPHSTNLISAKIRDVPCQGVGKRQARFFQNDLREDQASWNDRWEEGACLPGW